VREGERNGLTLTGKILLGLASLIAGTGLGAGILEVIK
jgi:hypothetical protein